MLYVLDIVETYNSDLESVITLFGRDINLKACSLAITRTPHTILVAVGDDFKDDYLLRYDLDQHLRKKPPKCRKLRCKCGGDAYGVFREPCIYDRKQLGQTVSNFKRVMSNGTDIYEPEPRPFLEFTIDHPFLFASAANFLRTVDVGRVSVEHRGAYGQFKTGVDSFMYHKNLAGFEGVEFPSGLVCTTYENVSVKSDLNVYPSHVSLFFFDIEVLSNNGFNTEDTKNAAFPIAIVSTLYIFGDVTKRKDFMLSVSGITDEPVDDVEFFEHEYDLLNRWKEYYLECDTDLILGYNISGYDIPYIVTRGLRLGIPQFEYLSRMRNEPLIFRTSLKEQAGGSIDTTSIYCPGRVIMDILPLIIAANLKLDSNKLDEVAKHFGLAGKIDLEYENMFEYFHKDVSHRKVMIEYCRQDVMICVGIEKKLNAVRRLIAKCRILRLRPQDTLQLGVGAHLLAAVRNNIKGEYVMPAKVNGYETMRSVMRKGKLVDVQLRSKEDLRGSFRAVDGYQELWDNANVGISYPGGFVVEPKKGFHSHGIVVLDYNSLYPSLCIAGNLCGTTMLKRAEPGCYTSSSGYSFLPASVKRGVTPRVMQIMLDQRARVRAKIPGESDPSILAMLNAEQLEYKLASNALYGQRGAITSELCCMAVAYSATADGASLIQATLTALNQNQEFLQYGIDVLYGDTDSLFIGLTKVFDYAEVVRIGHRIQEWVNNESGLFIHPLKMGFENAAMPFLSIAKKHYVLSIYDERTKKMVLKKAGIGTRRMTKFAKALQSRVFEMGMLEGASKAEIGAEIRRQFAMLFVGEVPPLMLRLTSNLSMPIACYKNDTSPHVVAARQLVNAGKEVKSGDRIPFYFCDIPTSNKNRTSELVVAGQLFVSGGYSLNYTQYAKMAKKSLEISILHFIQGATETEKLHNLHNLIFENTRIVKMMKLPPAISSTMGAMDQFVVREHANRTKPEESVGTVITPMTQSTLDSFFQTKGLVEQTNKRSKVEQRAAQQQLKLSAFFGI